MILAFAALAALALGDDEPLVVEDAPAARSPLVWSGRALALGAADLAAGDDEDTMALLAGLDLALAYTPTPAWEARAAARLRYFAGLRPRDAAGELTPELREARVVWRPTAIDGGLELSAGWTADTRLPELLRLEPPDLSLGPLPATGEPLDRRRPILLVQAGYTLGPVRLEALWQPVRTRLSAPLRGSDWAPWPRRDGPRDVAQLGGRDGLDGGALALHTRLVVDRLALGLGWAWSVDPVPAGAAFVRRHVVGLDAALTTGPLRWRLDLALASARTAWTPELRWLTRPALEGVVSVAASPHIAVDVELGARAVHAFDVADRQTRWLGAGPDDVELFLRLGLLLAFDGVLRLDAEGRLGLARPDGDVELALALRASSADEVALGLTIFEGRAVAVGRGALYDGDDELWIRWVRSF